MLVLVLMISSHSRGIVIFQSVIIFLYLKINLYFHTHIKTALLKLRTHGFLLLSAFLTPYISVVWLKKRKPVKVFLHISIIICWICIVPFLTFIYQTAPEVMFCCFSVNLLPNLRLLSQFESIALLQPLSTFQLSRLHRGRMSRPDSGYLEVPPAVFVWGWVSQRQTESVLSGGGKA